jgi:hypothetical protein
MQLSQSQALMFDVLATVEMTDAARARGPSHRTVSDVEAIEEILVARIPLVGEASP